MNKRLVVFYEKPYCAANAKQKAILIQSGCTLIVRNLLDHGLDRHMLRSFMGEKPVYEWFNPASPKIKNGDVDPRQLTEDEALTMMMDDPILIRRPLMIIGTEKLCGFDAVKVSEVLDRYVEEMPKINCMEKGCLEKKAAE